MPRRAFNELRPLSITPHYVSHPEGSALVCYGETKVICTASLEERVPHWLSNSGRGWVSAQYDMLPRATSTRRDRDSHRGKLNGRTQEISRLIGRSLRAIVNLEALSERMLTVDCDVIQADGGTRTASITGAYVALALAFKHMESEKLLRGQPLKDHVTAVSVGIVDDEPVLDLDYSMDSRAQVDMNIVMLGTGTLAEIQGTGEKRAFTRDEFNVMLDLALGASANLVELQKRAIAVELCDEPITVRL
ncbi:MAG: ribonuclease PH [Myxococcota bacterium]